MASLPVSGYGPELPFGNPELSDSYRFAHATARSVDRVEA